MTIQQISFDLTAIDGLGITVAIVGYVIVFAALVALYFVFNSIPKGLNFIIKRRLAREGKQKVDNNMNIPGEVNAAISMALYLYLNEMHDEESHKVTIRKINKQYSPWSEKYYNLNSYFKNK